jgi:predicted alpha/beta superfamily hydrolase
MRPVATSQPCPLNAQFAALFLLLTVAMSHAGLIAPISFPSKHLGTNRTVRIYLPPSYGNETNRHYPVLYMHDGQNVFSSAGPNSCFGWGSWEVDRTIDGLIAERRMREVIVVAIDNSRFRYQEYRGPSYPYTKKELAKLKRQPSGANDGTRYENYASFLKKELKPYIDRHFRTLPKPESTGIMGSSLGGICSLALAWENPKTFGLAASLSGSFQIERLHFLSDIIEEHRGRRKPIRIYIDSGVIDFTGDDDGRKYTDRLAAALRKIGWRDDSDLKHFTDQPMLELDLGRSGLRHDKWEEARHSQHNEFYWRMRTWRAFTFLFPP